MENTYVNHNVVHHASRHLSPFISLGMLSWIPVYPFDVVKTSLQNKRGDDGESVKKNILFFSRFFFFFLYLLLFFLIILIVSVVSQVGLLDMAKFLQRTYGFGVFYDGITPKVSFIQLY